jgi:phospholipid N-methyltransferase
MLGSEPPIQTLRGWAISPDALAIILRDIRGRRDPKVIEFGAGESTLAVAALLDRMKSGALTTVEHDEKFRDEIAERLAFAGLRERVTFHTSAIRQYLGNCDFDSYESYDLSALDQRFDVALVDGPIVATFGMGTRATPLEWCLSRIGNSAAVYLDDANRAAERHVIECVRARWPHLECRLLDAEKGLARFRVQASVAANESS